MNFPDANILEVDLSRGNIKKTILEGRLHRLYPGGSALGTYILLKELRPKTDPLSPDNVLVFSVSPLTGLPIAGANRITVTTKSPLTDGIGDSQAGGFFPAYLRANGWNAIVFKGRAESPVYLYIDGDRVELRDARGIWGKVTGDGERLIREDLGEEDIDIAQIGPGGENLVKFANIINLETIALANQLCNMYGLDTISCGATISFAMECFEKGILTLEDTGGIELTFGNDEALLEVIEKVGKREGIGNLLAEGSYRAARIIGKGAEKYSMTAKKQELPAHMPQYKPSLGLIYAVNPFGADHQSSAHDPVLTLPPESQDRKNLAMIGVYRGYDDNFELDEDKTLFAFKTQCFESTIDTLSLCQFVWGFSALYGPKDLVDLAQYGIGWDTSIYELMEIGERKINMMRYFNAREGFTREDDTLPERLFEPFRDGPSKGVALDREKYERSKELYYEIAGWDKETGNPREGTLKRLALAWLIRLGMPH